ELCKEFFETAGEDPVIRAFCRVERAALEAMTGQFDVARELLAEGTRVITELGLNVYAAVIGQEAFYVEMLAGNPEAAASTLRASYTAPEQMGGGGGASAESCRRSRVSWRTPFMSKEISRRPGGSAGRARKPPRQTTSTGRCSGEVPAQRRWGARENTRPRRQWREGR